jgi:hypothetical protein
MSYATAEDYLNWSGEDETPDNIEQALNHASARVRAFLPRDPLLDPSTQEALTGTALAKVEAALRDATCAHAQYLLENKRAGDLERYSSISLGPLQLSQKVGDPEYMVQLAVDYLRNAGLLFRGVNATTGYHHTYAGKMGHRGIITDTWIGGTPGP